MPDRIYRRAAWPILIGLAAFALYYLWIFVGQHMRFHMSGPEAWQVFAFVDDDALVPFWWRLLYSVLYLPTFVATEVFLGAAMWFVVLFLRGQVFDPMAVRALKLAGAAAAFSAFWILAAGPFDGWMLTAYNESSRADIRIWLDSGEMGVLLAGLGAWLLAHLLQVTLLMQSENREFV